jgi:hypothetical protein
MRATKVLALITGSSIGLMDTLLNTCGAKSLYLYLTYSKSSEILHCRYRADKRSAHSRFESRCSSHGSSTKGNG